MVAQPEVKQANPVTSGIVSRLASKEEGGLIAKTGKELKRRNDSVEEVEAGSQQAVKRRKSENLEILDYHFRYQLPLDCHCSHFNNINYSLDTD